MLRLAAKETVRRGSARAASSAAGKAGGGLGGKLLGLTALGGGVVGGTLGYAYVDPDFRKTVEEKVPQAKDIFDVTIGPAGRNAVQASPIVEKLGHAVADVGHKVSEVSHRVLPEKKELPPAKPKPEIVPVDLHKSPIPPAPKKVTSDDVQKATKDVERSVISQLDATQKVVKEATNAKIRTIDAINEHSKALKAAVDAGSHADWDKVRAALATAQKLANEDLALEAKSRKALDGLKKVIASGKLDVAGASAPILLNARDTADKLAYQLDELNNMLAGARNESRVFNQYKDLVDRSRKQFQEELQAVVPQVDVQAKEKTLNEEELNALIAHAHLRVDQLKRQLTEQQLREEKHIAEALEEQRKSDAKLSKAQLELELRRVREIQDVEVERKLRDERAGWEQELEARLRRAAAAHADNLEQVVRTQKQLHDIENAQAVDEAVEKERRLHTKQVELALEKLRGIETALNNRVALDAENRKAKQFWLACQNLHESISFGLKAGNSVDERRKPLQKELSVIEKASENDAFVKQVVNAFPRTSLEKGVYTEQDLKQRFKQLHKVAFRVASLDENGGGLGAYLMSYLQSLLLIDIPRRFRPEDQLELAKLDNREVLARAKFFVETGDLLSAVRVAQLLEGPAARLARDWVQDTRQHLEAKFLADLLLAHAAVSGIRTIY